MERSTLVSHLAAALRKWNVSLVDPRFVAETELTFTNDAITVQRSALRDLADPTWDSVLNSDKEWINASLLTTIDGRQVVALLPGRTVGRLSNDRDPSLNVSLEPRPLRLLDASGHDRA